MEPDAVAQRAIGTRPIGDLTLTGSHGQGSSAWRRVALGLTMLAAVGGVLGSLVAASDAVVASDASLGATLGPLALGMLALTVLGLLGLGRLYRDVRRQSPCGGGAC
jgi:hypothetical protein